MCVTQVDGLQQGRQHNGVHMRQIQAYRTTTQTQCTSTGRASRRHTGQDVGTDLKCHGGSKQTMKPRSQSTSAAMYRCILAWWSLFQSIAIINGWQLQSTSAKLSTFFIRPLAHRKSHTRRVNSCGTSSCGMCPQRRTTASRLPGNMAASRLELDAGTNRSCTPWMMSTGRRRDATS